MSEIKQFLESMQTVPHHIEQLCNYLAENGVSVFVKLLCTETSPVSGLENYSSSDKLELVTLSYTPSCCFNTEQSDDWRNRSPQKTESEKHPTLCHIPKLLRRK